MEVRCHESSTCMHYVRYKLWPVGYRKLCTLCFTMISFVLHRLAMPWTTDNGKSINKQNTQHKTGNRWLRILGVWRWSVGVNCTLCSTFTKSTSTSRTCSRSMGTGSGNGRGSDSRCDTDLVYIIQCAQISVQDLVCMI